MSRQDLDLVLNEGLTTAAKFIEKSGEFYPFGVVKTQSGEIRHIQVLVEESRPASSIVSEMLRTSLSQGGRAGKYETVAIVSNVEITDRETGRKTDAICVEIDDKNSEPILCYVPYEMEDEIPNLGDIRATSGTKIAFA